MLFKKIFIYTSILSSLLIFNANISAEETSVFCADKNKNWHWLNKGKTKVKGKWGGKMLNDTYYFNYFILEDGIRTIWTLKFKCFQEFGGDFIYAQPANSAFSEWYPFALNEDNILGGHTSYFPIDGYA